MYVSGGGAIVLFIVIGLFTVGILLVSVFWKIGNKYKLYRNIAKTLAVFFGLTIFGLFLFLIWSTIPEKHIVYNPKNIELKRFNHLVITGKNKESFDLPVVKFAPYYSLYCDSTDLKNFYIKYSGDTLIVTVLQTPQVGICEGCTEDNHNPYNSCLFSISAPKLKSVISKVDFELREVVSDKLLVVTIAKVFTLPPDHYNSETVNCFIENVDIKNLHFHGVGNSILVIKEGTKFGNLTIKVDSGSTIDIDKTSVIGKLFITGYGQLETSFHHNAIKALQR